MRFHKNVPIEKRELLLEQLKEYKKTITMTDRERKELHKWVAAGNSPYDNGDFVYGENGWPMDFVNAMRFVEEQVEWFRSLPDEEKEKYLKDISPSYDTARDVPGFDITLFVNETDADKELPF